MATDPAAPISFPDDAFSAEYDFRLKSQPKAQPYRCDFRLCEIDGASKPFLQATIWSVLEACKEGSKARSVIMRGCVKLVALYDKEKHAPSHGAQVHIFVVGTKTAGQLYAASRVTGTPVTVVSPEHLCALLLHHANSASEASSVLESLQMAASMEREKGMTATWNECSSLCES